MPARSQVRLYCAAVFAAGCLALGLLAGSLSLRFLQVKPWTFAVLAVGVVVGELLPIKIPRRGEEEEMALSTSFAMALLIAAGLLPALIAQWAASAIQDRMSGKPWWRVRFNLGQYTLAMVAAWAVLRALLKAPAIGSAHPFSSADLPAMLAGMAAFYLVNTNVVSAAVAMHRQVSFRRHLGRDPLMLLIPGAVMLMLAPIVLAAAAFSPLLVPLCLAPIVAVYNASSRGAQSEHAARHDSLTGLPNRAAFHEAVREATAAGELAAVLLIDLDRFKEVNDTLGHHYGDLLLGQVSERFERALGSGECVARLGGDEFAVLRRGCSAEQALGVARDVAEALRLPFELDEMVVDVQASVGIALCPVHGTEVTTLLQRADVAMYQAKRSHQGVLLYDERDDHHSAAKLALTGELRRALETDDIVVHYQPLIDLSRGVATGVEALVRWDHPQLGLLLPASFIEMAERTNLIGPLTDRVLEAALGQLACWRQLGLELEVAVNVSTRNLVERRFAERVLDAMSRAGVEPGRLKLEVTESALMADPVTARAVLAELDRCGVSIAIDDFGTGYSSLAYLADLPVSEVKIDQSFVSRMNHGSRESIIVSSTIELAHHLGLRATAEGVEDPALLERLRSLGCDSAQGYAVSRPLDGAAATAWLMRREEPAELPADVRWAA